MEEEPVVDVDDNIGMTSSESSLSVSSSFSLVASDVIVAKVLFGTSSVVFRADSSLSECWLSLSKFGCVEDGTDMFVCISSLFVNAGSVDSCCSCAEEEEEAPCFEGELVDIID